MLKERRQLFMSLFVAADLTVVAVAWGLAFVLRFFFPIVPVTKGVPSAMSYANLLPLICGTWGIVFHASGLYDPMRGASDATERRRILRASSLAMLIFLALSFLVVEKEYPLSRLTLLYFYVLASGLLVLERATLREILREARRRGYNLRHVLIVGDGDLARAVRDRMQRHPELGLKVRGFVTDEPARVNSLVGGTPVLGHWDEVSEIVAAGGIDQVLLALPFESLPHLERVLTRLDGAAVDVKVVPDGERFVSLRSGIEEFDGLPIISLRATPLTGWHRVMKRALDFAVAIIALGCSPAATPISLWWAPAHQPAFQTRADGPRCVACCGSEVPHPPGCAEAEADWCQGWRRSAPPRQARSCADFAGDSRNSGKCRGEMSLVGPRPERPVFIEEFRRHVPRYMLRHMVQAGMTGWAQVNGWRGNTSVEQRIEYDLYYIENWSLVLDLKILMLTFVRGFVNKNAY